MTSLSESTTFASSDSENYDANHSNSQDSEEPSSSAASSPLILYSPPTFWSILRGAAINLLLPFVNGLMLGFGELVAHEAAWRLGWGGTKVGTIWSPWIERDNVRWCGCRANTVIVGLPITSELEVYRARRGNERRPLRTEKKRRRGAGHVHRTGIDYL